MKKKTVFKILNSPYLDGEFIVTEFGYYAYISFSPVNISLMREDETNAYIATFSKIIRSIGDFSFICTDSEQNYNENIKYLKSRYENTENEKIKEIIKKDISFISGDRNNRPSKRVFIISLFSKTKENLESKISQTRKILNEYSIENELMNEQELRKLLGKYFFAIPPKEGCENYEGEKAIIFWNKREN